MQIKVTPFSDLGKASFGGLIRDGIYDTEKCHIYVTTMEGVTVERKIESVEDLCEFLWAVPGIASSSRDGSLSAYFTEPVEPWWTRLVRESVLRNGIERDRITKKLASAKKDTTRKRLEEQLKLFNTDDLEKMPVRLNAERNEYIEKLIASNRKE